MLDPLQKESVTHLGRCHVQEIGVLQAFVRGKAALEAEVIPLSELNVSYSEVRKQTEIAVRHMKKDQNIFPLN